jgi:hypothetical protein
MTIFYLARKPRYEATSANRLIDVVRTSNVTRLGEAMLLQIGDIQGKLRTEKSECPANSTSGLFDPYCFPSNPATERGLPRQCHDSASPNRSRSVRPLECLTLTRAVTAQGFAAQRISATWEEPDPSLVKKAFPDKN